MRLHWKVLQDIVGPERLVERVKAHGTRLGKRPYGYSSFEYDLTSSVAFGSANVIAVRVDNDQPTSRWYSGSGIYRNVWLTTANPVRVAWNGVFVATPSVTSAAATVSVGTEVLNQSTASASVSVTTTVLDPAGSRVAADTASPADVSAGQTATGPASAATALGIQSIPVDGFGVVDLALRAQARTPFFGAAPDGGGGRDPTPQTWRGARVKNLAGLDERSATGMGADVGVLVVSVPAQSQAAADGLLPLDVILQLGGSAVVSLDDLNRLYQATSAGRPVVLGIHRQQQDTTVRITR